MPKPLIALLAIALAACTGGGGGGSPSSGTDVTTPGTAVISDHNISSDAITISWAKTEGADAESWSAYHNDSATCSAELNASDDNQQSGSCSFTLTDGNNSIYVQLCNSGDACSTSDTMQIEHSLAPGAIYLEQLPSSTSSNQLEVAWVKEQGTNGDLWYIFHNGQSACSGSFALPSEQQPQSASCSIDLDFGEHQFQARLCIDKPAHSADICSDSAEHNLTSYFDSALELATPAIEALAASLPALATTINWSKNTADGSAGESWTLYRNNAVACGGTLAADEATGSCSLTLQEGSNSIYVELCTKVATYSGATCVDSALIEVEGTAPYALEPGAISITSSVSAQTYEPSLTVNWSIESGNGVTQWHLQLNDSTKCPSSSSDYLIGGSCSVDLALGANTISITGCNYGHEDSQSCTTSAELSTEYLALPGTPEITSSFPATTYTSEHNLSWERNEGEPAHYWLGLINDTSKCSGDLLEQTPQSGSCVVELDSGANAISVRLCLANESGSAHCSDSELEQVELLAPVPSQPVISTPEQSVAEDIDSIVLEWSKSSGANGSYWSLDNNGASVAACADQPIFSSGSSQSGSCSLPLALGSNRISVHLCADNAAGTASCSTSKSISIVRGSIVLEFTSASSASSAENNSEVFYTATVSANGSPTIPSSFSLSGVDSSLFSIDSSGGLAFINPPDFEAAQDYDQDNTYELNISASDLDYSTSLEFSVSVIDSNDETPQVPSFDVSTTHAIAAITLDSVIYTVEASDADAGDILTYSLGGVDASHFDLNSSSGELRFAQLPSLDQPQDDDGDNIYDLEISVSDAAANSTSLTLAVKVAEDVDSAPEFSSASASVEFPENSTAIVYDANATDADGDSLSYSLTGLDSAHLNLDPASGQLSFSQAPDYETPKDQNADNIYELAISATDNSHSTSLDLSVAVSNVNEAPQFAQESETIEVPENTSTADTIYTAAAIDQDGDAITYGLSGADSAHFILISATGALNFATSPDFENPQDQDGDNDYSIEIQATSTNHSTTLTLSIAVTDLEESAPYFANAASVASLTEDPATEGQQTPILALEFAVYDSEDDAANRALSLELEGADSSLFQLANATSANSHQVHFITSPDFDHPHDSDQDSNYSFTIVATDSDGTESQFSATIVVEGINDEAPYIDPAAYAYGDIIYILENNTSVLLTLAAYDEDRSDWSDVDPARRYQPNLDHLSFALTATIAESDSDLFYLDPTTLELSPKEPFDYETPQQQGDTANLYQVEIAITDSAGNSNLDHSDPSTRIVYVQVEDIENETITTFPEAETGPQIPWFNSNSSAWEYIKIPWVIYAGDGVAAWDMYVNGELKCSVASSLSSSLSSGTCAVPSSEFTIGSIDNTAQVSVVYADGRVDNSKTVTFGFAVPESEGYYPEQAMLLGGSLVDSGYPSDCADVEIGEPVNHDSHSGCYNYLLYDGLFGGLYNDVAAYLWSGKYGRSFDVIGYFIEWGVYTRDFDPHDMVANWLSTVLYSFIKFEGDNTIADDECENCTFSGAVAIADTWAALDKPFYMPGEEEKYADEAETEEELAEILLDKGVSTGKGIFQQFWLLKQKFPHLKTCLSVGGWSFSRPFPLVASDPDKRATFAQSIVDMAVEYHFDCIDIDWEFPGKAGGDRVAIHNGVATYDLDGDGISPFVDPSEADADYYVDLVATLRAEIDSRPEAKHIEINSAVYTSSEGMALMDYGSFPDDLDGIHMMTYDYYGAWDPHTGLQAALYANTDPVSSDVALAYGNPYNPEHNIASAMARGVNNAIYNGFRPEMVAVDDDSATSSISEATLANLRIRQKIVPGLAFYGRNYSGVNMDTPTPLKYMVRATGTTGQSDGSAEQLGWEPGNLNYNQIRGFYFQDDKVQGDGDYAAHIPDADDPNIIHEYSTEGRSWTYNWDDEAQAPFLYDAETGSFITYSDPRAIFYQTCHAAWHNSKGVMFWELSGDNLAADLQLYIQLALRGYRVVSGDRDYATCEDLDGIYPQDDIVYSDGSDGGGDSGLAGYGLAELVDLGHVSEDLFSNFIFPWRNGDPSISDGSETYTWDGFATAAEHFADFGFLNQGSIEDRLRELAAFFANSSQETHNSHGVYALINKDGIIGQGRYNAGYYYQQEQACAVGGADYGQDICSYCDASHVLMAPLAPGSTRMVAPKPTTFTMAAAPCSFSRTPTMATLVSTTTRTPTCCSTTPTCSCKTAKPPSPPPSGTG